MSFIWIENSLLSLDKIFSTSLRTTSQKPSTGTEPAISSTSSSLSSLSSWSSSFAKKAYTLCFSSKNFLFILTSFSQKEYISPHFLFFWHVLKDSLLLQTQDCCQSTTISQTSCWCSIAELWFVATSRWENYRFSVVEHCICCKYPGFGKYQELTKDFWVLSSSWYLLYRASIISLENKATKVGVFTSPVVNTHSQDLTNFVFWRTLFFKVRKQQSAASSSNC